MRRGSFLKDPQKDLIAKEKLSASTTNVLSLSPPATSKPLSRSGSLLNQPFLTSSSPSLPPMLSSGGIRHLGKDAFKLGGWKTKSEIFSKPSTWRVLIQTKKARDTSALLLLLLLLLSPLSQSASLGFTGRAALLHTKRIGQDGQTSRR